MKSEFEAFVREAAKGIKTEGGQFDLELPPVRDSSLSPSYSKRNKHVSPPWMTRS